MKVLQIINRFDSGGAEKLLLETIPRYNAKGIHVDLLLLNGKDLPFLKSLEKLNCCKINILGYSSAYNPINIFKIIPFLRKYDIAHVHLFPSQYWVIFAKFLSFSDIKLIVTEHSSSNPRLNNFFFKKIDKFMYQFYQKIVCITDEVYKIIRKHTNLPESNFEIIENGIDLKTIQNANLYSKEEISESFKKEDILSIHIARFSKHKDHKTVIRSMNFLPDRFKLILVGDGDLKEDCEKYVKKLNLEKRIKFLGIRTDIPQLLKSVDISILSSEGEGFGLVAIESMASGTPFIASDVIGLSQLVKNTGILFEKGNEKELAFHINNLMNDKDLKSKIINAGKIKAQQYDIEIMTEKHIQMYKSLLLQD